MKHVLHGHRFTLIELLISLTVLSLMILLLMQYLTSTQRAWRLSEGTNRVYDDARVAQELLERDLNSSLASDIEGEQVGFYVADQDTDGFIACFISDSDHNRNSASRLCELTYRLENNEMQRRIVTEADGVAWDFFDQTATSDPDWVDNGDAQFETIIGGVEEFGIEFYAEEDDTTPIAPGTVVFDLPNRAVVHLVLYDEMLRDVPADIRARTRRSFTKVVFLNLLIPE